MPGQLCLAPEPGWAPGGGAGAVDLPVVEVLGAVPVVLVELVVLVVLAALAIAAPPPTSAPVTASVVSKGFSRPMYHLLSDLMSDDRPKASESRRTRIRVGEEEAGGSVRAGGRMIPSARPVLSLLGVGELAQARERPSKDARDLHLRYADLLGDLRLGHVVDEAQREHAAFARR